MGSTLLRRYLELVTGIATGSDVVAGGSQPLSAQGMVGEHIVDERVWIAKTSYPVGKRINEEHHSFQANKVLILARNPVDTILAKLHSQLSGTRSKQVEIDFS